MASTVCKAYITQGWKGGLISQISKHVTVIQVIVKAKWSRNMTIPKFLI